MTTRPSHFFWLGMIGTFILTLSGCAPQTRNITLTPHEEQSPPDTLLLPTLEKYLLLTGAPRSSQYHYARFDINGDGLKDALVLFDIPHTHWCGWGGCTLVVLSAHHDGFSILSKTSNVRGPLIISPKKSDGFNDIIVRLSGMDRYDQTIRLRFHKNTYPSDATQGAPLPYSFEDMVGQRLLP